MSTRARIAPVALFLAAVGLAPHANAAEGDRIAWAEGFASLPAWGDPSGHNARDLAKIYGIQREGDASWLHARHDARDGRTPAMHFGRALARDGITLDKVRALEWRWRVTQHPATGADPWLDLGASVYVIFEKPTLLSGGKGLKLGWVAKPASRGGRQRGIAQIPLRADPAGPDWRSERVDLCALFRAEYGGSCASQKVLYIGVVTDADGTKSVAEADYDDFRLVVAR